jgi:methylmalonyl-CoA/ethylmalonyl-CoA epimerase
MKGICSVVLLLAVLSAPMLSAAETKPAQAEGLGTRVVVQIAVVVKDIEKSAKAYADVLGVPVPKWELTDSVEKAHTLYLGRPSKAQAKLAFIEMGNIVIELIEPVGGPSTWREFLETKGEGLHHIAFEVKDMDKRIAELKAKGVPLIQTGDYTGGRYAYLDGTARLALVLELLENVPEKK